MKTINWQDMSEAEQCAVFVGMQAAGLKKKELLLRLLDLAKPTVVFAGDMKSFEIAAESKDVLAVVIKTYYK